MIITQQDALHRHLSAFVDWIATEPQREETIRDQADEIRSRICAQAKDDGLTVRSTPWSGSYKKRTGLRRHMHGKNPIEGQDVDLPFVVSPVTVDDEKLSSLLSRFAKYAQNSYPATNRRPTRSSVKLSFAGTKLSYDLVPMLATASDDRQILIRQDGDRRETSVQKHIEFVTSRTRASNDMPGRVKFNECVRLFKWWREVMTEGDVERVPTMPVELLCAYAFDKHGVERTYPDTLLKWFGFLANAVSKRSPIYFADYVKWTNPPSFTPWAVVDPVNPKNNVASGFKNLDVDMIASWLESARDAVAQAMSQDLDGNENAALEALVPVFGSPVLNHGAN